MNTQIAIYIMKTTPTDERINELVSRTSIDQFNGAPCTSRVSHEVPEGQPTHITDQLEAKKRDNPGSIYLIVEPEASNV